MQKIIINPKFEHLREFITNIDNTFDQDGVCIYDMRNKIKVFEVDGFRVNVKRYCIPPLFFNRIIYKLFRKPKAERAYRYAHKLQELGFETPTPIAYIVESSALLINHSYLFTVQESYAHDIGDFIGKEQLNEKDRMILNRFGRYTAKLHKKGVYHSDYGEGNILFNMVNGEPIFSLLDINRMTFGEVSMKRGCYNFSRLKLNDEMLRIVATAYAVARNFDKESVYNEIISARKKYRFKRKLKRLKFK